MAKADQRRFEKIEREFIKKQEAYLKFQQETEDKKWAPVDKKDAKH